MKIESGGRIQYWYGRRYIPSALRLARSGTHESIGGAYDNGRDCSSPPACRIYGATLCSVFLQGLGEQKRTKRTETYSLCSVGRKPQLLATVQVSPPDSKDYHLLREIHRQHRQDASDRSRENCCARHLSKLWLSSTMHNCLLKGSIDLGPRERKHTRCPMSPRFGWSLNTRKTNPRMHRRRATTEARTESGATASTSCIPIY